MKKRNFKRIKKNTFFKIFKKIVYKRLNKNKILFFSKPKVFPILRYYIRKRLHRKKKKLLLKRCKLRLKIKFFNKRRYNFFFKFRRFKKKKIKKLKRKSYRKLRFFRKRKKFITSNFKVKYYFNNKPKNNIIVLFNIKFVKNLRLFLFYQSYGKFNFKKKFRLVRKRWSYKSPLMRLNFFYKLHMFMKLFRAQMLNYEYIIPIFKEKIMVYLKNIKVLYPLEYVWFKEYNLSRLLIRLHVINSYRLGLVWILNNFVISRKPLNIWSSLKHNTMYSIILNFHTLSTTIYNYKKIWRLVRLFRRIRYIHRKIIRIMMRNHYLQLMTHMNQLWSKYFEIDFKQLSWIYIYTTKVHWNSIYFTWFNYWNSRVFGWKFIT